MISCYAHKVRQKYCAKGSRETDFHPLEKVRRCVKMRTFFFYAQSPDFHKQGLCYYLKILYL